MRESLHNVVTKWSTLTVASASLSKDQSRKLLSKWATWAASQAIIHTVL